MTNAGRKFDINPLMMDSWGRYDCESSSSSSDDDDVYYGDFRKPSKRVVNHGKFDSSVIYKPSTLQRSGQVPVQNNDSFSSTSSESPTYELNGQFSGSESSLDDSNSPLDLSTPKGWKNKDSQYENGAIPKQKQKTLKSCEQLKWPNQRVIISKIHCPQGSVNPCLNRDKAGEQSTSSFSSIKGELGESPDIAGLDTPSSCDDNSPIYQNTMKGKRLFDIRALSDSKERQSMQSFSSLASMNVCGFQGNEGLASYTSLPYTSYLEESHARYGAKSLNRLPSSASMMSNFNETVNNEREEMANMSNFSSFSYLSSASALRKCATDIKDCKTSDSSPMSLISNFPESVSDAREGLASYNSLTSLYKSPSESIYAEIHPQNKSSEYIQMDRLGEGLASYTSLPTFQSEPSSEEPSFNMNSTILAAPQTDYIDMNQFNVNHTYSAVKKKPSSKNNSISVTPVNSKLSTKVLREQFFTAEDLSGDYVELSKCQAYLKAVKDSEVETAHSVIADDPKKSPSVSVKNPSLSSQSFNSQILQSKVGCSVKVTPNLMPIKQLFRMEDNTRSISPSPFVSIKSKASDSKSETIDIKSDPKLDATNPSVVNKNDSEMAAGLPNRDAYNDMTAGLPHRELLVGNKSTASLMSFQGEGRSMMTSAIDLTVGDSLCERREGLASCSSLPDFSIDSEMCSPEKSHDMNDVSKISQNGVNSSQNVIPNTVQNITEICSSLSHPVSVIDSKILNCGLNLSLRRGTHSDSGVDCASVSSPFINSEQVSNSGDGDAMKDNEVFSHTGSSSLNSTSSMADTDSCNQCLSQTSESSEVSSHSHSGKGNATVLLVNLSDSTEIKMPKGDKSNTLESISSSVTSHSGNENVLHHVYEVNMSASTSMSSVYSTCSNASSVQSASIEGATGVKTLATSNDSNGNLSSVQANRLNESKHSINSESENASLLSLYGNGASTPRASAKQSVSFPQDHLLVSPIASYSRVPVHPRPNVGGSRVVRSPCVKPSMLNLKDTNADAAFLNSNAINLNSHSKTRTLENSANVNSEHCKSLKDKEIPVGRNSVNAQSEVDCIAEEEEEVQMVYANAFRRVDVGSDIVPSNVVVRSTVKRVPSITAPKQPFQSLPPHQNNPGQFQQVNSHSLGSLSSGSSSHVSNAQVVNMRMKAATVRNVRPQSALGRIQGDYSTLPRTKTSRVVRLQTTSGTHLSPHRGVLPDIVPFDESEQDMLVPPPQVIFKAPLPVSNPGNSRLSVVTLDNQHVQETASNSTYMPMSGSLSSMSNPHILRSNPHMLGSHPNMPMSGLNQNMQMLGSNPHMPSRSLDTVSVSSLFQHGSSEDNYAMDSSNSSLDCDNFSFDFNQPEDSGTSVMFSSTVDFRQSENCEDTAIYQDIDAHGLGAHGGGHDFDSKTRRSGRENAKPYENGSKKSPKLSRKSKDGKENSPDKRNYPKSPLPNNSTMTREKKTEPVSPKKHSSRFFNWAHRGGDSSPKSKLFGLKKKKDSSKSKRKKEAYDRYEPAPVFDHDTDWKTKLHTLCNGRRVVRYLNYSQSQSPMIIKHYPPPKESTRIKWNSNLIQDGESDDSNEYAVIHPKSILSKKSKEYKYDGDVPSPIIITKTRQLSVSGRRHSKK